MKNIVALLFVLITFEVLPSQISQEWIATYNGPGYSDDQAYSTAVDNSGNVYVIGNQGTIKYNSTGIQQWISKNGKAKSIVVDNSGNIYVTGSRQTDYLTIKYNSDGISVWEATYNGQGNSVDEASSIVVDNSGNVYVTGYSIGSGTGTDFTTIKYNSTGTQMWESRFNGPGNGSDTSNSIALDNSGNIYVTGVSFRGGNGYDFTTLKYNSAGDPLWVANYNGPGNSSDGAVSIALDNAGNVFVTGYSIGIGTGNDYATIKYNSLGIQQWVSRYNGLGNSSDIVKTIKVDNSNNIYITGESVGLGSETDYATIKYNSGGTQQWESRYNGPGNFNDKAASLVIDGSGNVYVTGESYGIISNYDYATIKYNSQGVQQWVSRYNGSGNLSDKSTSIAFDNSGNIYITGGSYGVGTNSDYSTIKYSSLGIEQWVATYNGPGVFADRATSMAIDNLGNIYVTGSSSRFGIDNDYATIKYNSSGEQQWVQRYNGPGNSSDDEAKSIAVDGSGNVYVTGGSPGIGTNYDFATIKYNSLGEQQWVQRYNGPGNSSDEANSIAVDGSGNVYVSGYSAHTGFVNDYATVKYNSSGVQQWVQIYNAPGNSYNISKSIALDGSGNVFVTGSSALAGEGFDYATIKYNITGDSVWVKRYNGTGNSNDLANSIAVDGSGNIYVTGGSDGIGTMNDYATIKYNSSGEQQWVQRYNGPGNSTDQAFSIAEDGSGNVYITGYSYGIGTESDFATIKYNSTGDQQWVQRYNGPGNSKDIAYSLAVDGLGNVYVTGTNGTGTITVYDYTTIKYNSTGEQQWVQIYDGTVTGQENSVAVDGSGNVYVTGSIEGNETGYDYITIKYSESVGINQISSEIPEKFGLSQNYPNPFNPGTNIKFIISKPSHGKIIVYNTLGMVVANLVDEQFQPGTYEVKFDGRMLPSGIYFYRIETESFTDTKKMLLIK